MKSGLNLLMLKSVGPLQVNNPGTPAQRKTMWAATCGKIKHKMLAYNTISANELFPK